MNINWLKVGKVASIVLSAAAGIVGAVVNMGEVKSVATEATKKLFEEQIKNK